MQNDFLADLPYKSFTELLDYQAQNLPNKTCLLYPDLSSDPICYASATFAQVNAAANHLAFKYSQQIDISSNSGKTITVGLLANSSTDYLITIYALVKLGVIVFPLSIRNSQAALEHLIKTTGTSYLIVGPGQIHIELDGLKTIPLGNVNWNNNSQCSVNKTKINSLEDLQMIFHSSGSTSFPKPIQYTNRSILNMVRLQMSHNTNVYNGNDTILCWGALFHILGFSTAIACFSLEATYALPLVKNYPPTPKQLLANVQVKSINKLTTVPSFLEQLVYEIESDASVSYAVLSHLEFVFYGGASLPDKICYKFVDNGIHLISGYGSTECGMIMITDLKAPLTRWKYMKINEYRKPYIKIRPEDNVLVVLSNDPFVQRGIANQSDGSYSTNDIFIEDPPGSGEYRIDGRRDDTLIHINGEKTNPIPMEDTLVRFPIIHRGLIFGHQRLCTGVLVELNRIEADNYSIDEILDKVWEAIEVANKSAPGHSRIVRQMVKCLPMNKTLPTTEKGNIIRKRANDEYAKIIDDLYEKFLNPNPNNELISENKEQWNDTNSLRTHLQKLISKISLKSFETFNDTSKSIFEIGFDSLQAVQLHNELCKIFPSIQFNFIYEYSTIDSMINKLFSKTNQDDPQHYILTENLIDKYINQMKNELFTMNNKEKKNTKRVFLITGANGSLGSWIILDLLKQNSVTKIFCLFRGQNQNRIIKEFEQRHQTIDIFNKNNNRIVLLHNMQLSDQFLGQNDEIYNQLSNEVTDIIHSAYRMDFNLTVRDFEKDGILGTYNLLKLTGKAKARFHFISSVASSGSGIKPVVKEEALARQPQLPIAQGYGQSKYICEHLCAAAKQFWDLSVDIYRVGQVSGDSKHGAWNTSEMISLIICHGGGKLGQMPSQGQDIRWIPVDIAASSIVEIALQNYIKNDDVHHIINPHAITWSKFLDDLKQAGLRFRIVNPVEWLEKVLTSQTDLVKLSSFFDTFFTSKSGFQISEYETIKTETRSKCLHSCLPMNTKLIKKYLTFWYNIGFLTHGYE